MTKQVELNYYTIKDLDSGCYVLEWDWILNLFNDYNNAIKYVEERGYVLEDHCN